MKEVNSLLSRFYSEIEKALHSKEEYRDIYEIMSCLDIGSDPKLLPCPIPFKSKLSHIRFRRVANAYGYNVQLIDGIATVFPSER